MNDDGLRFGSVRPAVPLSSDPFEDGTLDVPTCPTCLHSMEAAGSSERSAHWVCPVCGQTALA